MKLIINEKKFNSKEQILEETKRIQLIHNKVKKGV